jgi:hypothetical protein
VWPWEHLAIGYVAASLLFRGTARPLTSETFLVLAVATQFPDLVDKPLAWAVGVLPSGTTLAHSIFFAIPLCLAVIALTRYYRRGRLGVVFAVGYLLHLPGDILYGTVTTGQAPAVDAVLWPIVPTGPADTLGLLEKVLYFWGQYEQFLTSSQAVGYLVFEATLLGVAFVLWRYDGYPGVSLLRTRRQRG